MDSEQPQEENQAPAQEQGLGLTFQFDPEAKALLATVEPNPLAAPVDEAWLRARLADLGHAALRFLPTAATVVLAKYNTGQPLSGFRIAEAVDAVLSVRVANDFMSATLDITPAEGGAPVTKEQVLTALGDQGIVDGVLVEAINRAIAAGSASNLLIAQGRPPVPGADGELKSLLPEVRSRAPRVDLSGFTDYRDLGEIFVVRPGDPLMERQPPHRRYAREYPAGGAGAHQAGQGGDVRGSPVRRDLSAG